MTQQLLVKSTTAAWYLVENANQLLYSTDLTTGGVWLTSSLTVTGGQTDPNAGTDAYRLAATAGNATYRQTIDVSGGSLNRVISVYLKRVSGTGNIQLTADGTTWETVTITGSWARYDVSAAAGDGPISVGVKLATSGDAIDVAFFQYEDGLTPTAYTENQANRYTITQIVDADYPANTVRGCVFLDGFFFVMTPKGEIQQSALEDASSWAALDFIQSQNDPSAGVYLAKQGNYIVALKEWAIEFFYNAGNPVGSVLSPVQNAAVRIGCASAASVQDLGVGIAFIGHTQFGQGRSVYLLSGTQPQKISTPDVEKIINQGDLAEVHSWTATVGTHTLYGVTLVTTGVTLVYDFGTQQWSLFTYLEATATTGSISGISAEGVVTSTAHGLVDGDIVKLSTAGADFDGWHVATNVTENTFTIQATGTATTNLGTWGKYEESYFPVVASVRANGRQYMQDGVNGALYEFSMEAYADAVGAIAARIRTPKLDGGGMIPKFMASAEVVGDKIDSTLLVRYSDDDYQTYSKFRPVDLAANRSRLRRLGNYNRRAFELLHVKPKLLRLEALEIDE